MTEDTKHRLDDCVGTIQYFLPKLEPAERAKIFKRLTEDYCVQCGDISPNHASHCAAP